MIKYVIFVLFALQKETIRKDYRELLELTVIFLGGQLPNGNRFRALIPIHHARWMAKAIYALKIFLFRDQFQFFRKEKSQLANVCIFIVSSYLKAWFTASDAVTAPNNDLVLLKELATNANTNSSPLRKIYEAAFKKFKSHLWYLSEFLVPLALFDESVSTDYKRKMCQAMKTRCALSDDDHMQRKTGIDNLEFIQGSTLDDFFTKRSMKFFEILRIDDGFLECDPSTWVNRDDFAQAFEMVRSLHVTNDVAERSVSLIIEYNNLLAKDEAGKQNLLLVVNKHRELSPGCTKHDLTLSLETFLSNQPAESPVDLSC